MKTIQVNRSVEITNQGAFNSSVISFAAFIAMFASFTMLQKFPDVIYLSTILAIAFHVALLPVVTIIPAPAWTKIGGYTWVAMDIILAVAGLNGVPNTTVEPFRYGVHVMLVLWPIGIAIANDGLLKWASILFAITTGVVPLLGTMVSPQVRFVGFPFVLLWYVAVILYLRSHRREDNIPS
jgi:hypothetical protein